MSKTLAPPQSRSQPAAQPSILPEPARTPGWRERLARRAVPGRLARLQGGCLTVQDGGITTHYGDPDASLRAQIEVRDPRFWSAVAFRGSIGAGEAWMRDWWRADDLTAVVRILVRNRAALDGLEGGLARLSAPLQKAWHALRRNTRTGSRRNISAHYDLGNDFFALFLDESLTYSCAIFADEHTTLAQAQTAKLDRLCRKLELEPGDHLLEIGTGWGSMALHAARTYGCRVTTTTISQAQHQAACARVQRAGLQDRVTILLSDYRDLEGQYDKLVSVEMIEAIGHRQYDTFFKTCSRLLAPGGMAAIQAITIDDRQYEQAIRSVEFIQRYIFPGSNIPSVEALTRSMARAGDLRLFHLEDIGPHYARTLREWRARLDANREAILALGYTEELLRMWTFYLCYCEGGFEERALGDVQLVLVKPESRRAPVLGAL